MARDLKVGIAIEAKDGFSAGAGKVAAASRRLSQHLEAGPQRLSELGARDASLKRLDALGSSLGQTAARMDEAARRTASLRREFKASEQPSKKLERAFEAARSKSTALRREHVRQRDELRGLRRELREAGFDTRDLGAAQRDDDADFERASRKMRDAQDAANRAWDAQTEKMAQISLAAEGVGRVGSRMREIGFAPVEAARSAVGDTEGMASLFTRGYANFRQLFPDADDRQFGGSLGALVTSAAQDLKTTGPEMQQAIERMGAGLSNLGISAGKQFALLGILQSSLGAPEAGGRAAALYKAGATAQDSLAESGRDLRILDERDNLLPPSELVAALRAEFGEWSTLVGGELRRAFGSREAVEIFELLWNRAGELGESALGLDEAARRGEALVREVQAARDDNAHARMQLLEQRITATMEEVGASQLEALEAPLGLAERLLDRIEDRFGAAPVGTAMLGAGALGSVAEVAANLAIAGYGLRMGKTWWDRRSAVLFLATR